MLEDDAFKFLGHAWAESVRRDDVAEQIGKADVFEGACAALFKAGLVFYLKRRGGGNDRHAGRKKFRHNAGDFKLAFVDQVVAVAFLPCEHRALFRQACLPCGVDVQSELVALRASGVDALPRGQTIIDDALACSAHANAW